MRNAIAALTRQPDTPRDSPTSRGRKSTAAKRGRRAATKRSQRTRSSKVDSDDEVGPINIICSMYLLFKVCLQSKRKNVGKGERKKKPVLKVTSSSSSELDD